MTTDAHKGAFMGLALECPPYHDTTVFVAQPMTRPVLTIIGRSVRAVLVVQSLDDRNECSCVQGNRLAFESDLHQCLVAAMLSDWLIAF